MARPSAPTAGHAGQVALDVGGEDGHTRFAEGLGHQLEGLGLAGARGPGDEPVPVKHRQRNADGGLDDGRAVHQHTQLHRLAVEPVSGLNRCHQFFTHAPSLPCRSPKRSGQHLPARPGYALMRARNYPTPEMARLTA